MKLRDFSEVLCELEILALNPEVDIFSAEVQGSTFYNLIHNETELDASFLDEVGPEVILLIARIAATSPLLHTIDISFNYLDKTAPNIVKALARSNSLHAIYMNKCEIGKYGYEVAIEAIKMRSLNYINLDYNYADDDEEKAFTELILLDYNFNVKPHNYSLLMGAHTFFDQGILPYDIAKIILIHFEHIIDYSSIGFESMY